MGQLDQAKEIIDHAIQKFPDDEYLFLNLSQIFELKKDYLSALNYLNKSIQINPNYYEAYLNRGNIFHEMKLTKDAMENFNYAIKLNPDYADAYLNLGMVYLKKDRKMNKKYPSRDRVRERGNAMTRDAMTRDANDKDTMTSDTMTSWQKRERESGRVVE